MKMYNPFSPPPAPPAFGAGKVLPEAASSWLSRVSFHWLGEFLDVGFSRPLEKDDLWELPQPRHTNTITADVERNFYSRCPSDKRPAFMRYLPSVTPLSDSELDKTEFVNPVNEKQGEKPGNVELGNPEQPTNKSEDGKYDQSLFKALRHTFFKRIWFSAFLLVISDTLRTTTPLLNKIILTWLTESYIYFRLSDTERTAATAAGFPKPRGIGYGIGLAFALFVMQESASVMSNHFMLISMTTGLYVRTGLIGNIFRKSLRLSGRARNEHSMGQITTMISTDATHLDLFTGFAHHLWGAPVQIILGIGLLIGTLGYSALVGLGVVIFGFPFQLALILIIVNQTKKGVKITDKRVRLTTEVLQGIRLIKMYGWEAFYIEQITKFRTKEIKAIRKGSFAVAWLVALFSFIPVLASVLSFIAYKLSGHDLNIAVIFTSLQLFNIIRLPLLIFPFVLSSLSNAIVSLDRISKFLTAEELAEPYQIDQTLPYAVQVNGDFTWETVIDVKEEKSKAEENSNNDKGVLGKDKEKKTEKKVAKDAVQSRWWKSKKTTGQDQLPSTIDDTEIKGDGDNNITEIQEEPPFSLKDLRFEVPKGAFVAIVGRVGCGKSSLLQAMIGEMRRTKGEVIFSGSVAYVPQVPWIRNATLRENVLFGKEDDEKRFRDVVEACNLEHDLAVLPQGENTAIGEKGINLSGGQKARVSLARAAYAQSDIVILDDPLSAVDAYVGKYILDHCLLEGPLASRTRILVTHSLHVLDKVDYIYVMDDGAIIEQGTYSSLMSDGHAFSRLIEEYGSAESRNKDTQKKRNPGLTKKGNDHLHHEPDSADDVLMQLEERNTGAVSWEIYKKYLHFAGGLAWAPVILVLLILTQGNQVATTLFLGFWTGNTIKNFTQGCYMAVYAALGVSTAITSFALTYAFVLVGLMASLNLFKAALSGVLASPTSFFDTTPMGRILSRLSKDQSTIDQELPLTLMQFLSTFSSVIGTIALVFYAFPYLGIIFLPMAFLYYFVSVYYRRSSVETKRLDSLLRSILYGSYSETLTGLSTIRAYREQNRCLKDAEQGLNMENRAYLMTISMQRWLAVRLDFFGNILVLGIGLFAAGFRTSVNPAKIGVVLTYTLSVTQVFSEMISMFATSEQNMNAVERVVHYSELSPEGNDRSSSDPPPSWPAGGMIKFINVKLAYREGLPLVLKGIDFQINPGEKIGVVGRTGAGKSSLIQALLRTVELQDGKIEIDGLDVSQIDLNVLRSRLAIVPQDTTLFLGTLRDNLDPQRLRTDAEVIAVLQRAWLLPEVGTVDAVIEAKFSLDSIVGDEGSNYSAGEKQLLALSRALVKNSRIIILDEATSSVDVETDSKVQRTIQTEFASSTLLCIAHRLNTIAHYDRIIVMDDGKVAEFDTVLNLFDRKDSIFRSLCDEASLERTDLLRLQAEHANGDTCN